MAGALEMPRHRIPHHAQAQKCHRLAHDHLPFWRPSLYTVAGRGKTLLMTKWLLRLTLAVLVLAGLAGGGAWLWLRTSLPSYDGRAEASGLGAPTTMARDRHAVPHIRAESATDAYYALGFAHAQDRLWQMEMSRRIGAGRMAEVLGPAALPTDRFLRVLGVYRHAERGFALLDGNSQAILEAYAKGVNAYLRQREGALPPEFVITRHRPEPWRVADSLVWLKMMAWDLGGNWQAEIQRARLSARLTPQQIAEFLPPYPGEAPVALPDLAELYRGLPLETLWASAPRQPEDSIGSNNWVVAGRRSATGKPLLANDPHLGLAAPSVWYLARLSAPGLDAIGATLPGVPAVILGRNRRVAWGMTNTGPDVQDLYVERVDPADPKRYLTPEGSAPFVSREEVIAIKGQPSETLTVRATRHGPVISDVDARSRAVAGENRVLAMAWTALTDDDPSFRAALSLGTAASAADILATQSDFVAPQQNLVFADGEGRIGMIAPGRVPVRGPDNQARDLMPVPGWEARNDWRGFVPYAALPRALDPPSGAIATANHKIVPARYPHHITSEWAPPYRARRIEELLASQPTHSIDSFRRMQNDNLSAFARDMLPLLLAAPPADPASAALARTLGAWNGDMARNRPEPLIFSTWIRELARGIYADELGPLFEDFFDVRPVFLYNVLTAQPAWCDDVGTKDRIETCPEIVARALVRAREFLVARHGDAPERWRWDEAHPARGEHRPFGRMNALKPWFDLRVGIGGDAFTVNAQRYTLRDELEPFVSRHGASYRAIYDLDDLDRSLFIHSTGQSGNPLSPHYRD
ncbi:MAG: penicillin acylase family protein, partial [Alphaproteobacteria bacterium]|nr:penicillin acylase family protein [Alphaproteobacteria bacterium]